MPSTPLTLCSIGSATSRDDGRGAGAGIACRHLHGRRHDVGILRDRKVIERDDAEDDDQQRDDVGENRPLDEELGDHWASVPAAAAAAEVVIGTTVLPGSARMMPPTTTRSFGLAGRS